MRTRPEVLADLRTMLRDMLTASAAGAAGARLARAHGYVDGYMRALLDLGVSTRSELLEVVAAERQRLNGPATRVLDRIEGDEVAA
jgi:hypothetical protein